MLGKCFKHEWKSSWKIMTLLHGAVLLMGGIGGIGMAYAENRGLPGQLVFVYFLLYVPLLISALFSTNFLMIQRYYRNLFTDEGYLTNVLPVTARDHILSKMLVYLAWYFLDFLCIGASFLLLLAPLIPRSLKYLDSERFFEELSSLARFLGLPSLGALLAYLIAFLVILTLYMILLFYCSISLGSLFSSHKVLAAVLIYLGLNVLMQIFHLAGLNLFLPEWLSTQADPISLTTFSLNSRVFHTGILQLLVIYLAVDAALYLICHYVLSKKLNLQ